ncbi:MAG: hypothetical protein ACFFDR_12840 [Candidatus Thorarchaeota archaeon]
MRVARVVKAHRSEPSVSLVMKEGDVLQGEKRTTEWDGWLWCTNASKVSAWVPEAYLSKCGESGMYEAIQDYDSIELPADIGEEVAVLLEEASWGWVRSTDAKEGWIPLECLMFQSNAKHDCFPKMFCSGLLLSSVI